VEVRQLGDPALAERPHRRIPQPPRVVALAFLDQAVRLLDLPLVMAAALGDDLVAAGREPRPDVQLGPKPRGDFLDRLDGAREVAPLDAPRDRGLDFGGFLGAPRDPALARVRDAFLDGGAELAPGMRRDEGLALANQLVVVSGVSPPEFEELVVGRLLRGRRLSRAAREFCLQPRDLDPGPVVPFPRFGRNGLVELEGLVEIGLLGGLGFHVLGRRLVDFGIRAPDPREDGDDDSEHDGRAEDRRENPELVADSGRLRFPC
jgi:hypothetical protein